MSMPKGHKSENGYATVSGIENGLDYRSIAEIMSEDGYKMNHATARNIFLKAMKKLAKPIHELYDTEVTDDRIMKTAKDPRFQESMIEIIESGLHRQESSSDEIDV